MADPAKRQLPAAARSGREWVVILPAAVGLALALRLLVLDACRITSGSMEATLLPGDRVLIDKLAYGAPAPGFLPPFRFPGLGSPRRGDVVLFEMDGARLVKRCLAIPGDTVELRGDAVFINGAAAVPPATSAERSAFGPIIVPRNQYFMVGDNSEVSYDSRHFGFVPGSVIIGRALMIYWSLDAAESGTPRRTIRWSRIGRMIP